MPKRNSTFCPRLQNLKSPQKIRKSPPKFSKSLHFYSVSRLFISEMCQSSDEMNFLSLNDFLGGFQYFASLTRLASMFHSVTSGMNHVTWKRDWTVLGRFLPKIPVSNKNPQKSLQIYKKSTEFPWKSKIHKNIHNSLKMSTFWVATLVVRVIRAIVNFSTGFRTFFERAIVMKPRLKKVESSGWPRRFI